MRLRAWLLCTSQEPYARPSERCRKSRCRPMLTFFATAKPFIGQNAIIQRNALESWKQLSPEVEVILFGDEPGAAEICGELGLHHEPQVKRHESGMKFLNYMFER